MVSSTETAEDKRKQIRYPFRENILIDGTLMLKSIDISTGGVYVYHGRSFPRNTVVTVSIPLGKERLAVKAKVQHDQPSVGMGLMFINLDAEQKLFIQRLIQNLKEKSSVYSPNGEKKILFIENDKMRKNIYKSRLTGDGFSVILADDYIEALNILKQITPDCIVLDLNMKKMDGFKFLSILRCNEKLKALPIIVFSSFSTQDAIDKIMHAGADEFLCKILTTPEKLSIVTNATIKRKSEAGQGGY